MPRAAVIVPFPFDEEGLDYRRAEMEQVELSGQVTFDYKPLKAGPKHFIGRHDEMLVEFAIFEAGIALAEEGYDAITVNTLSDSGVPELRAVLDIPVVSNGKVVASLRAHPRHPILRDRADRPDLSAVHRRLARLLQEPDEEVRGRAVLQLDRAVRGAIGHEGTVFRPRGRGLPQDEGGLRERPRQGGGRDRSRLHDSLSGGPLSLGELACPGGQSGTALAEDGGDGARPRPLPQPGGASQARPCPARR